MKPIHVSIIDRQEELPEIAYSNFFHSAELFSIIRKTPGEKPYMVVATDAAGQVVGHLLALIRRRGSWLPPYFFTQGRIFGEGEYADGADREAVFGAMLHEITRKFKHKFCLYAEFSDLSKKMFGYRYFRQNGYFPVHWQEIHNSLHSMAPEERLSEKMRQRIRRIYKAGVETREAQTDAEVAAFYHMLRQFYRFKVRRFMPREEQIRQIDKSHNGKIFITLFKGKVIGGCACVYSGGNAFLWYLASKRKSHPKLRPNTMTIWHALRYAYEHNYAHFYFLDAGLPFRKNPFRDFLLSFGGKPVAKFRWFRVSFRWINNLLSWLYRE